MEKNAVKTVRKTKKLSKIGEWLRSKDPNKDVWVIHDMKAVLK